MNALHWGLLFFHVAICIYAKKIVPLQRIVPNELGKDMSSNLQMKILAKETAIYGASSIVGKFLNWMLVPLYTYVLQQQSDYGIVTNLYAWTALLLVILLHQTESLPLQLIQDT